MTQGKREFEDWLCHAHQAKRVALLAHVSPDGDTLGSTLALRLAFLALGKQVNVICDGDVPDNLKYLPGQRNRPSPGKRERRGLRHGDCRGCERPFAAGQERSRV